LEVRKYRNGLVNQETKWFVVYHDYSDLTAEEKLRLCPDEEKLYTEGSE
jgi:DNA gyrase inhibitor GyrI